MRNTLITIASSAVLLAVAGCDDSNANKNKTTTPANTPSTNTRSTTTTTTPSGTMNTTPSTTGANPAMTPGTTGAPGTATTPGTMTPAPGAPGTPGHDADNTGRNKRDAATPGADATKTPMDQGNNAADLKVTADIRRAVVADGSLSTNAHNCKIITAGGVVTLRGPVETQAEKDTIETLAKAMAGVTRVDNQLEVKAK